MKTWGCWRGMWQPLGEGDTLPGQGLCGQTGDKAAALGAVSLQACPALCRLMGVAACVLPCPELSPSLASLRVPGARGVSRVLA